MPGDEVLDVTTFPESSGFFTKEELEIMMASASEIIAQISKKKWTAEKVTLAFCKLPLWHISWCVLLDVSKMIMNLRYCQINCVTETMFSEALAAAKLLDEEFSRTGNLKGPLHGVPISLKDDFGIAGKAGSVGFVSWANDLATSDSSMVTLLKASVLLRTSKRMSRPL